MAARREQPEGCSLTRRGYGVPSTDTDTTAWLRDVLTVTPKTHPGSMQSDPKPFPVFSEKIGMLYLPRAFGLSVFGPPPSSSIHLERGQPAPALSNFIGDLRPSQVEPASAFMAAANDPRVRGGIISLPCGAGKTVVAIYIMSLIARKTMIVAAKEFLLHQWRERLVEFLPSASVGLLRAQTCDVHGRDVVLVSLQSLSMKTYPHELFKDFDLCIFDECHHLGAEVFSRALPKVATPITMGLSATLDRRDGLRRVFEWFLGPVVFEAEREVRSDFQVNVLTYVHAGTDPSYGRERVLGEGRLNLSRMLNEVCACLPRTEVMLDALTRCMTVEPARKVLILTDRRAHITDLTRGLINRGILADDIGHYVGGAKQVALKTSEACKYIIGTFAMAAEGFDVPALDTLLLASPVSSIEQAIGRIGRSLGGAYTPLVIDIVDDFSVFRRQAARRRKFYVSRGYTVRPVLPVHLVLPVHPVLPVLPVLPTLASPCTPVFLSVLPSRVHVHVAADGDEALEQKDQDHSGEDVRR